MIHLYSLGETGKYPIKNFTPEEYKAGIQNIDFAQNRDMDLFVANNLGVLSFNGNEWEIHASNTGQKQRSLAFDESTNRLYVGSQGEFGFFHDNWIYVSLIDKIPQEHLDFDEVWDVFLYNSKTYFCTFQGIYIYEDDSVYCLRSKEGFNRSFYAGSRLFTQSSQGKLFEIDGTQLMASILQGKEKQIVAGMIPYEAGLLIIYNSGNVEYSTTDQVKEIYPELIEALQGTYVNHVMQLSDGRLLISTQRSGLYLYNMQANVIENITTRDGLQSNACLRAFQDHTGNVWLGLQNGIALIDINSPLKLINEDINLEGSGYEAFDTDDGTYYTTSNGIYFRKVNEDQSSFLSGTEGPAYGLRTIKGRLYAGHHTGLFLLEKGRAKRCAVTNGLWDMKQIRSNPGYAIGGTYSGLRLFRHNEFDELEDAGAINGFNESSRFFEEDMKGRLWVGQYYKGLYQLELNGSLTGVSVLRTPESFDIDMGEHVILSRVDDDLYLGTDQGIYKIDQASDQIVKDELFSNEVRQEWVYVLEQDEQNNVHIYTEDRVGFFKQVSPKNFVYVPSSLFQLRQSFNNDLMKVSTNVDNGVFFNANEGFIHYDPNLEERISVEKQPLVSRVYSVAEDSLLYSRMPFQDRSDSSEMVSIVRGAKVLKFAVESFKYKDVNNRQFRYFLKGFDTGYSEWSNVTFKEYTNLTEGYYEFYVQTSNYLGEIVTSKPFRLEVNPPYYRTVTAKILYGLMILSLLAFLYRIQRQYYKGKQQRIERVKEKQLSQKQKELNSLKEEQIKTELRHVNNQLAASTMNLVVKNEFMENIKEEIRQVKLKGNVSDTEKALERIIKEIDTTLKLQEDWKQFEYHFDRVHGDFLTRLTNEFRDLTPGEQKLCAFLRLKMDTKEVANLMGISLRGVEVARFRLRKKLRLDNRPNLSKFILDY